MKNYVVFSNWIGELFRYEIDESKPITYELIRVLQENHITLQNDIKIEFISE